MLYENNTNGADINIFLTLIENYYKIQTIYYRRTDGANANSDDDTAPVHG